MCLTAASTIIIDVAAYRTDPPSGLDAGPNWGLVGVIGAVGAVALLALAWRPARTSGFSGAFSFAVVLVTVVAALVSIGRDNGVVVPMYLRHAPGAVLIRMARQAIAAAPAGWACVVIGHDPAHLLPTPYQRCASQHQSEVSFMADWDDQHFYGLVYSLRATGPDYPDSCARHLSGGWWAEMYEGGPASPCASSFRFVPAP